jgi:hypothetical protein
MIMHTQDGRSYQALAACPSTILAPADGVSWSHDQVPLADRLAATMVLFLILLLLSITVALILTRRAVTVLRTASTGTVPTATLAEARSPDSWDGARPLATAIDGLDDATAVWQLSKLREARQLVARMRDAKAQSSDVLEFAFVSPDENSSLTFSLAFMPDGDVIISERARGFPLGFLPYFSLIREVDLLPSLLPPVIARPLEELSIRHRFANNDLMYHVCARGFGPIPGADDLFFVLLFDVTDAPHDGAVLAFVETPPAGANVYRDLELPPCTKRGYTRTTGLGMVASLTPTANSHRRGYPPMDPGEAVPKKESNPMNRGEAALHGAAAEAAEAEAEHGWMDLELIGKVALPIPRWLLPSPLIRWFVPFLVRKVMPSLTHLNSHFDESALRARVTAERDGFYAELQRRLPAMRERGCRGVTVHKRSGCASEDAGKPLGPCDRGVEPLAPSGSMGSERLVASSGSSNPGAPSAPWMALLEGLNRCLPGGS